MKRFKFFRDLTGINAGTIWAFLMTEAPDKKGEYIPSAPWPAGEFEDTGIMLENCPIYFRGPNRETVATLELSDAELILAMYSSASIKQILRLLVAGPAKDFGLRIDNLLYDEYTKERIQEKIHNINY